MKCPFWNHESYIDYCVRNMQRGQDNVHLYDGEEGSGKSNGAIWDARKIHERLGKRFDIAKDPIFNRDQWSERFDAGEKQRVYELDEFENIAFSRDYNRVDNKEFVKLAQQARILRSTIIAVMPYLQFADVYFRQGRFRVRVQFRRVTDYDVPCPECGLKHEIREADYNWRVRREDPETGEVTVRWQRIFTARHCPLALTDPEAWAGYEASKESSVRATAAGRGHRASPRSNGARGPGRPKTVDDAQRSASWGRLPKRDRLRALALAQDAVRAMNGPEGEPPTPTKRSNKSRPGEGDSLFSP